MRAVRADALPQRHGRGFTLLEVLVALAIVAIALGAGLRAAGALTDNAERLSQVIAAQWCADNQLTTLRLSRVFPGPGESDFSCEQLGRSYRGKLVTRPTPNPSFNRVDAVISDEQGRPLVTLSTVIGRS
ncbi:MAG: type II secretion system minor pseudopilin GspI [Pseudomonadota bacterium]|jgi:general secretion pathway protein I|nr:type II secretion system minor pseudopilin GspI [Rubrivivax sp.]MCA3258709.1 type II secretion system minor pseudopilin GspI [Rubrivivax sp.]MCE2912724.1 type II secretion system minor pseudopilin GspI [Rubrivivax sp.]MCZ8030284.1 type II secretion system minor pseudopilin GspI [Rubrivivax sp.]